MVVLEVTSLAPFNACNIVLQSGSKCQTADKKEYPGHLRKVGIANLTHRRQGLSYCTKLAAVIKL